jgi:hypothetical protein
MNFNEFNEDIEKNNWKVYGVEVYKQGKLIYSYGDTWKKSQMTCYIVWRKIS